MSENYILLVEDDPDLAELVLLTLEEAGYETRWARDGSEALEAVATRMPQLILLDMMMPGMNGWQFARRFRADHGSAAPMVVVTAAENARARAGEVGAEDWIAKPFDVTRLLHTVARWSEQALLPRPTPPGRH